MDRWFRLKIMTWKWIVLSKTGNRINLSYRHNFGFVVRKLTVLKSKVWILLYSNIPSRFLNCFEEFWGCFSSPILLDPVLIFTFLWVWVRLFLIFFFSSQKFQWEILFLGSSVSWNDIIQMFKRPVLKLIETKVKFPHFLALAFINVKIWAWERGHQALFAQNHIQVALEYLQAFKSLEAGRILIPFFWNNN